MAKEIILHGTCRICGKLESEGLEFESWVRPTFTNQDILHPGEIICNNCLFWFEQKSGLLQQMLGKDKPQKMQNYSHFIKNGEWIPVSKASKDVMLSLLITPPFPELAAIADSGQKHLAFRAPRNPEGQETGWVQFEEQKIYIDPSDLIFKIEVIEELYTTFTKDEIYTGNYSPWRIMQFGLSEWEQLENKIRRSRGSALFELSIFLAQRKEQDGNNKRDDSNPTKDHLEGDTGGLQEPVQNEHLGAVREPDQERSKHGQPWEIHQHTLFETGR